MIATDWTYETALHSPEFVAFLRCWEDTKAAPLPLVDWFLDHGQDELAEATREAFQYEYYPLMLYGREGCYWDSPAPGNKRLANSDGWLLESSDLLEAVDHFSVDTTSNWRSFPSIQLALAALLFGLVEYRRKGRA